LPPSTDLDAAKTLLHGFPDQLLRTLVDSLSDVGIFMLTPGGQVASWNAGAAQITGYSMGEAVGMHFSRFFVRDGSDDASAQMLRDAAKHGRAEAEGWQVKKDGGRYWAITVIQPVRAADAELIGFAVMARDATERHGAESALLESERRFRLLVDGVTDYAIYMLDPSGVVTNWNAGAERLKGYEASEIVGQHFSKFYTAHDRASGAPARVLNTAVMNGRYEGEGWRVRKDGSRFWASVVVDVIRDRQGKLLGFAKVTRDISERRAAQEALRESERHLRLLIDGVRDYALFMLDPNGLVSTWNSGARRIKGYEAQDVIGTHFSRFYVEDDRAAGLPARALAIAEAEGRVEMEGWRVRKDGSMFWANVVIDRIRDVSGRTLGFAKITRDITERRNNQLALEEAQARAGQAQKMEALGHLTGGVAHDFNNLLMIISGQNNVLKRQGRDNPKAAQAAEAIENAIARGASLTRQLLTFSRRQNLSPRPVDMAAQIADFKAMLLGTMSGLTVLTTVPPGTWPVIADPNELELSLLNLAINARDAMSGSGTLTITAENVTLSPTAGDALEGEFVAISLTDTGSGIPPDILPKIFDPFFTTKQAQKGSGLGLSQVHGFTHQSGGKVAIHSELGRGTRVTLYLPRAAVIAGGSARKDDSADITGHGTVLVVDDNPDVSQATAVMLRELGYQVTIATDAAEALARIAAEKPLLVLSDIVMPGANDGVALARELKNLYPDLPVVLMTGYAKNMPADHEFPVMRKPSSLAELGRILRSAVTAKAAPPDNLIPFRER
jgi:PAS domain S-box-containing protein